MVNIPITDLSAFLGHSEPEARKAAARDFAASVKIHGCAGVTGHGVSTETLQDAFATINKFFDLPITEKMKAPHPEGFVPHRGYLAKEVENSGKLGAYYTKSEQEQEFLKSARDWKETYDIGHEENYEQNNIWLPDETFPGFRSYMVGLYERLNTVASAILEALMLGMELSEKDCETLRQIHSPVHHQMRLAHYLPLSHENQGDPQRIRLAPHRDFSSYTLLFQADQSGLEFENRQTGEYMPATPKKGVLYFNVGEIFERYSNGFYPSAMHRVSIPPTKAADGTIPGRLSIPFFVLISQKESIYPMPSRVKLDGFANYEPTSYPALVEKLFSIIS